MSEQLEWAPEAGVHREYPLATALSRQEYRTSSHLRTGIDALDRLTGGLTFGDLWVLTGPRRLRGNLMCHLAGSVSSREERTVLLCPLEREDELRITAVTRARGVHRSVLDREDNPELLRSILRGGDRWPLTIGGAEASITRFLTDRIPTGQPTRLLLIDDVDLDPGSVIRGLADVPASGGAQVSAGTQVTAGARVSELPMALRRFARRRGVSTVVGLDALPTEPTARDRWESVADHLIELVEGDLPLAPDQHRNPEPAHES